MGQQQQMQHENGPSLNSAKPNGVILNNARWKKCNMIVNIIQY